MIKNKPFIDEVLRLRKKANDNPTSFAVRNKASPLNNWEDFQPFILEKLNQLYFTQIDGIKLKFQFTTLLVNGRHKSK